MSKLFRLLRREASVIDFYVDKIIFRSYLRYREFCLMICRTS